MKRKNGPTLKQEKGSALSMDSKLPSHESVTHLHLLACLNTLFRNELETRSDPFRILDIGCGNGALMAYLHLAMHVVAPHRSIEIYGFDIGEQGFGDNDEYVRCIETLDAVCRETSWAERLSCISADEEWPYEDGFFDAAVSNQVLEHVADLDLFAIQLKRVLKPDGASVHLFPLKETIIEAHIMVPYAHHILDTELQAAWIALCNRLGVGRWRHDKLVFEYKDIADYAEGQAAYLANGTRYRSFRDFHAVSQQHGLTVSHRYTSDFFRAKAYDVLKRSPRLFYRGTARVFSDRLAFLLLSRLSSSTLVIRPKPYDVGARIHMEKSFDSDRYPKA